MITLTSAQRKQLHNAIADFIEAGQAYNIGTIRLADLIAKLNITEDMLLVEFKAASEAEKWGFSDRKIENWCHKLMALSKPESAQIRRDVTDGKLGADSALFISVAKANPPRPPKTNEELYLEAVRNVVSRAVVLKKKEPVLVKDIRARYRQATAKKTAEKKEPVNAV